jgi:glyoxylase-like metal-dependent hydrolase (beta-lactamase superfamily II)
LRNITAMTRPEGIATGVAYLKTLIVNTFFVEPTAEDAGRWVLVDAGLPGYSRLIIEAARERFGSAARPAAIVLTHGHFDHVGSLPDLLRWWDVPVYAHPLELPYLTGRSAYPPPDPLVGGGALSWLARAYPRGPINLRDRIRPLPESGDVPALGGWRWIHTPGHTAGHVSLFREEDRTLISGDAIVTVKQESALAVLTRYRRLHRPPAYFTTDWTAAADSVRRLAALEPLTLCPGHGRPISGAMLPMELARFADTFACDEVPLRGRYVAEPALADDRGIVSLPPDPLPLALRRMAGGVSLVVAGALIVAVQRRMSAASR